MKEIFVFGSNLAGRHGAGAAKHAAMHYLAERDVIEWAKAQCGYSGNLVGEAIVALGKDGSKVRIYQSPNSGISDG